MEKEGVSLGTARLLAVWASVTLATGCAAKRHFIPEREPPVMVTVTPTDGILKVEVGYGAIASVRVTVFEPAFEDGTLEIDWEPLSNLQPRERNYRSTVQLKKGIGRPIVNKAIGLMSTTILRLVIRGPTGKRRWEEERKLRVPWDDVEVGIEMPIPGPRREREQQ